MDYIKGATDYLGITATEPNPQLTTAGPDNVGAVSANDLIAKKDLNEEILQKGPMITAQPAIASKKDINSEILNTDTNQLLHPVSTLPDTSAKQQLNDELRHTEPNQLLHPVSTLPDTSAKQQLNSELLHTEPKDILHHADERRTDQEYQNISLQSGNAPAQSRGINLDSPSISSRPEFQKTPFVANSSSLAPTTGLASHQTSTSAPVKMETIHKDVVVHERIHPVQKEEIQPIIHREREQLEVKQVTQMMHETQIQPTIVQQRELPAERRDVIVERGAPIAENVQTGYREVDATQRSQVVHAPIVNETVRKTVVEEVQPVLERDVFVPTSVQTTVPIYEKIVEAPQVYRETVEVRELGTHQSGQQYTQVNSLGTQQYSQGQIGIQQLGQGHIGTQQYGQGQIGTQQYGQGQIGTQQYGQGQQFSQVGGQQYGQGQVIGQQYGQQIGGQQLGQIGSQQYGHSNIDTTGRRLSSGTIDTRYSVQNQQDYLPTGQVLPTVQSSRPAYAQLPANYHEQRPDFIGTGSQYVLAANAGTAPGADLQKGLYNPYINQAQGQNMSTIPQAYPRQ